MTGASAVWATGPLGFLPAGFLPLRGRPSCLRRLWRRASSLAAQASPPKSGRRVAAARKYDVSKCVLRNASRLETNRVSVQAHVGVAGVWLSDTNSLSKPIGLSTSPCRAPALSSAVFVSVGKRIGYERWPKRKGRVIRHGPNVIGADYNTSAAWSAKAGALAALQGDMAGMGPAPSGRRRRSGPNCPR